MVKIPVVSIEISTVDLLNALVKAKGYGDKIGLVCHRYENLDALENRGMYSTSISGSFPITIRSNWSDK